MSIIIMTYTPLSKEEHERFEKSQQEFYDKYVKNRNQNKNSTKLSNKDYFRIRLLEAICEDKMLECTSYSTMFREMQETIAWLKSLKWKII